MIIGLSGKYCAGKNAAAKILEEKGIPSIDVDKLGHLALEASVDRIEEAFGSSVITQSGISDDRRVYRTVDRKALGQIVFSKPAELKKLEAISHPWMKDETARLCKKYTDEGSRHVVVNAAILYKMQLDSLCDCIIWINAPLFIRISRALKRDSSGIVSVLKRIYTQRQLKPKPSEDSVDIYRVGNKSGVNSMRVKLEEVLEQIEQKGKDGR